MNCQGDAARDRFVEQMQLFDTATYLPDDILQKVDRASMAVSLEVRPPLLDHRVVAFAWRLPRGMRIHGGETKWLLRRVLDRYVPRELVSRPKMGFGIPLASWLRGPLREWAEDLLDPSRLGGGLLDVAAVRKLWTEHRQRPAQLGLRAVDHSDVRGMAPALGCSVSTPMILHIISGLGIGGAEASLVQIATALQARGLPQHVVCARDAR